MFRRLLTFLAIAGTSVAAQTIAPEDGSVRMTVTLKTAPGNDNVELKRGDVLVFHDKQRLPVMELSSLQAQHGALELFLLIDDSSSMSLGSQLADLRGFIQRQPAQTRIGIAYMQHGSARVAHQLAADRAAAVQALRLPLGAIAAGASPFLALDDLFKKWPDSGVPREVLMISSGIDPLGGRGSFNPFLVAVIEHAQMSGIIVHTLYAPQAGRAGRTFGLANSGQDHLTQLAGETGGESYGLGSAVTFEPYLRDLTDRLQHQYTIEFQAPASGRPELVSVKFESELPGVEIIAAPRVFVWPRTGSE